MDAPTHPRRRGRSSGRTRADRLVIEVLLADRTALLRLEGELDVVTARDLVASARRLVGNGSRHVVVDCGHLGLCDSGGLDALVAIGELPGVESVGVVRPSATMRRLLAATGLAHLDQSHPV